MPISDPQAIRFVNEKVRPIAEQIRALKATIDVVLIEWNGQISPLVTNDSQAVADGRDAEGASRLTGADVINLITALQGLQTRLDQAGVRDVISKPCVRPFNVS